MRYLFEWGWRPHQNNESRNHPHHRHRSGSRGCVLFTRWVVFRCCTIKLEVSGGGGKDDGRRQRNSNGQTAKEPQRKQPSYGETF